MATYYKHTEPLVVALGSNVTVRIDDSLESPNTQAVLLCRGFSDSMKYNPPIEIYVSISDLRKIVDKIDEAIANAEGE